MPGVSCDFCQKNFRTRYNLRLHMAVHTGIKPHICNICNKGFQQKWNLLTHQSRVHNGEKPFQCQDCGKTFGYSSHFKVHLKMHFLNQLNLSGALKDKVLNPFECNLCFKRFASARMVEEHMQKHNGEPSFCCNNCNQLFRTRRQIVNHFKRRCGGEKEKKKRKHINRREPIPCEICGKVVARYSMPKHLNIHTRKRVYPCKTCNRTFLESGQLIVHERTHSGFKPHICEVCGRGHAQLGNLLAHRRRHHGLTDRPWSNKPQALQEAAKENDESLECLQLIENNTRIQIVNNDKENCTGNETIDDFLNIAQQWVVARDKKSNESRIDEGNEKESIEQQTKTPLSLEKNDISSETGIGNIDAENCCMNEDVNDSNKTKESKEMEVNSKSGYLELKEELLKKVKSEIGENKIFKATWEKAVKKNKRDALMWTLRQLGNDLPMNSVIQKTDDGSFLWKCWDCNITQKSRTLLIRHRLVHAPPHLHPHQCTTCGRTFTQAGNLKHHLLVHKSEHRFFCEICGTGFRHKPHFITHKKRHNNEPINRLLFQCDTCGKSCSTGGHLAEHYRTHTGERPYLCRTCGRTFRASSTFARHIRQHDGEKEACSVCGKQFSDKSTRKRHEVAHSGRPEHVCSCGKTFTQKASLNRHAPICVTATEPALRTFCCPACPKAFFDASSLKRHSASHDPERRFQCEICSRKLKTQETLNRHLVQHRPLD